MALKAPSQDALGALMTSALATWRSVPEKVFPVVTRLSSRIGDYPAQHPSVALVTFTGSSATGLALAGKTGMIPLMLELDGKDAAIVLAGRRRRGHRRGRRLRGLRLQLHGCTAVKRVLDTGEVADSLVAAIARRTRY